MPSAVAMADPGRQRLAVLKDHLRPTSQGSPRSGLSRLAVKAEDQRSKVVTAQEAVAVVPDGATITARPQLLFTYGLGGTALLHLNIKKSSRAQRLLVHADNYSTCYILWLYFAVQWIAALGTAAATHVYLACRWLVLLRAAARSCC